MVNDIQFADVRHLSRFDGTTPAAVLLGAIPDTVKTLDLCCTKPRGTRRRAHAHAAVARGLEKQSATENDRDMLDVCTQREESRDIQREKRARDQETDQKHEAVAVDETCNTLTLEMLKDVAKHLFDNPQVNVEIDKKNTLRVCKFETVPCSSFGTSHPPLVPAQQVIVLQTLEYAVFRGGPFVITDKGFIHSVEQWRELLHTVVHRFRCTGIQCNQFVDNDTLDHVKDLHSVQAIVVFESGYEPGCTARSHTCRHFTTEGEGMRCKDCSKGRNILKKKIKAWKKKTPEQMAKAILESSQSKWRTLAKTFKV